MISIANCDDKSLQFLSKQQLHVIFFCILQGLGEEVPGGVPPSPVPSPFPAPAGEGERGLQ